MLRARFQRWHIPRVINRSTPPGRQRKPRRQRLIQPPPRFPRQQAEQDLREVKRGQFLQARKPGQMWREPFTNT